MFTFIHTYSKESWKGIVDKGLYRPGDGIKVMHTNYMPEEFLFNNMAKIGGELHSILSELKCPFYIDRLQGGVGLPTWYDYDKSLISHYIELLGENFWGYQIHEWASNYRSDCERIADLYKKRGCENPTPEQRAEIWADIREGREKLFLEAFTPVEWTSHRDPQNYAELMEDINELYTRRAAMMGGDLLIPADSYFMAHRIEIANGVRILLPEVGWQIPDMRIQMAYTRGIAKASKIRWGVYYECWGGMGDYGLTIPFSLREGQDEWIESQLQNGSGHERTPEERERGGSSRSLQERAWRYAYLSGATAMGEEYGVCNTFRNYNDFDLSPYGQVKYDFLRFTEKFPEIGETFTPFAIVLPANMPMWEIDRGDNYLKFPLVDDMKYIPEVKKIVHALLGKDGKIGNQNHVLRNGGFPDVFDMIHADQTEAIAKYDYLIDLSYDPAFAKKYSNIVNIEDIGEILDKLLPCSVSGELHTVYNRTADGWLVYIANNDGIINENFEGDKFAPEAAVRSDIAVKSGEIKILDGKYGCTPEKNGNTYSVTLGAGDWMMFAL